MRQVLTGRATRLWLALTAAGAMMAAVVLGIAGNFQSPQGDDHPSFSSSQSVEDESFVAIKWHQKPSRK